MGAFVVKREYRTNSLSHTDGGTTVFVKYPNGQVRAYKDVKYPWNFRKKILEDDPELKAWY
jgi:hypothetical protein